MYVFYLFNGSALVAGLGLIRYPIRSVLGFCSIVRCFEICVTPRRLISGDLFAFSKNYCRVIMLTLERSNFRPALSAPFARGNRYCYWLETILLDLGLYFPDYSSARAHTEITGDTLVIFFSAFWIPFRNLTVCSGQRRKEKWTVDFNVKLV